MREWNIRNMGRPIYLDGTTGIVRVGLDSISSGLTLSTITTLNNVTSMNQLGGFTIGDTYLRTLNRLAFNAGVRSRVS